MTRAPFSPWATAALPPRRMTPHPPWPSIPAMFGQHRRALRRPGGRPRRDVRSRYAELAAAARRFGAALVASGVEPGDRVAIWCFNCAEWMVAALGIFAAGAVLVPVNTRFKGAEAADMLARERGPGPRDGDRLPRHRLRGHARSAPGAALPALETVVVARGTARGDGRRWADFLGARDAGRPWPRSTGAAPRSARTTARTSSSPRARRACPRAS